MSAVKKFVAYLGDPPHDCVCTQSSVHSTDTRAGKSELSSTRKYSCAKFFLSIELAGTAGCIAIMARIFFISTCVMANISAASISR